MTSKRISRWYDRMTYFDYDVQHIKGSLNVCADMLSRLSQKSSKFALDDDDDSVYVSSINTADTIQMKTIQTLSQQNADLRKLEEFILTSWPKKNSIPEEIKKFYEIRNELSVKDSCIYHGDQLIIPDEGDIWKKILKFFHSGHPGIV